MKYFKTSFVNQEFADIVGLVCVERWRMGKSVYIGLLIWLSFAARIEPVKWTVIVITGHEHYGGITGDIYLNIFGEKGQKKMMYYNEFSRYKTSVVTMEAEMRTPKRVVLELRLTYYAHDKGWIPKKVILRRQINGTEVSYTFACNGRWMYSGYVQILHNPVVSPPDFKDYFMRMNSTTERPTDGVTGTFDNRTTTTADSTTAEPTTLGQMSAITWMTIFLPIGGVLVVLVVVICAVLVVRRRKRPSQAPGQRMSEMYTTPITLATTNEEATYSEVSFATHFQKR
ncbi:uncharacterized protein LOC141901972 [Tubulanus polymorphus]|uniref:uncharacterized protein LOC141901972 n=1 Tax=Tubulanus polymorphus TaxID=672921 RepID=UPI003DA47080